MGYDALTKLVMKGVTTKAAAQDALDELTELIGELETQRDELESGVTEWSEGEDGEARMAGKEQIEEVTNALNYPLSSAGECAGMKPYEVVES